MARRIQIFTRVSPQQEDVLKEIGREEAAKNADAARRFLRTRDGEVNTSEVIRYLMAKADVRMREL